MFEDDTTPSQSTQEEMKAKDVKYTKTKKSIPDLKVTKSSFQTKASVKKKSSKDLQNETTITPQKATKAVVRAKNGGKKQKTKEKQEKSSLEIKKSLPLNSFTKCVLEALYELNKIKENE